jgi:osmotically-inducible protein OsmY
MLKSEARSHPGRRRPWRGALVSASLVLTIVGCATMDPREDTRIEAEVKAQLVAEKTANLTRAGVMSSNGAVYLTGTVASAEQRAQAEVLAKGVRGVQRVVNRLDVRTEAR